jgi:superfamily II DNA or RNA helicase
VAGQPIWTDETLRVRFADLDENPNDLFAKAIEEAQAELDRLTREQAEVRAKLVVLRDGAPAATRGKTPTAEVDATTPSAVPATAAEKVRLFRERFRGRTDVFPRRWENARSGKSGYSPACANEWVRGVCGKPKTRCSACSSKAFLPIDDQVIFGHLTGEHTIGVYPLLPDDTCWFVAADFDEVSWKDDVLAFAETCRAMKLPVAIERSRSGSGAHAWFFFAEPVSACHARRMVSFILTETMSRRHELSMQSYDRLFPSQDTLPKGGFGNLIALPFQRKPRQAGNSLFLDDRLEPFDWQEQWRFLASMPRLVARLVSDLADEATRTNHVVAVGMPDVGDEETTTSASKQERAAPRLAVALPAEVPAVLSRRLVFQKSGLPPVLIGRLKRLAAFQNPEFYQRERLRLSTARVPRVISCADESAAHLELPRGCRSDVEALLATNSSRLTIRDERQPGCPMPCRFLGELTGPQQEAAEAMLGRDIGVIVAPPGTGKTVIGTYLVAARGVSTLVLVHRKPLLDQWVTKLAMFLGIATREIGQVTGGKKKANGRLDVAMIQTLFRDDAVSDHLAGYGHVIVDECHHIPAFSFERVLKNVRARYLVGLTATPKRRDGHHPICEMQLGPVAFAFDAQAEAAARPFEHSLIPRETQFTPSKPEFSIQEIYRELANDHARNDMIVHDVSHALAENRVPLVLTERKDHLETLADLLRGVSRHVIVMRGGMVAKENRAVADRLSRNEASGERVIVATGRYVGEGFDDARLDTLFLTMPVSWKGTLIQYAGRLHRRHPAKREVRIYDYVDVNTPMLSRMFEKRLRGYRSLGYARGEAPLGFGEVDDDFVLGRDWAETEGDGEDDLWAPDV